jgi:hypothetical protein
MTARGNVHSSRLVELTQGLALAANLVSPPNLLVCFQFDGESRGVAR